MRIAFSYCFASNISERNRDLALAGMRKEAERIGETPLVAPNEERKGGWPTYDKNNMNEGRIERDSLRIAMYRSVTLNECSVRRGCWGKMIDGGERGRWW